MGLFLLGIPLAMIGAKMLHDDVKYTTMDLKIPKASHNLNTQYMQIDENFAEILQYSGAKCDVKKKAYGYDIKNVKKGQYGGMERYLAEKGYFAQAITYAKNRFDALAKEEEKIHNKERDSLIDRFETKLMENGGDMTLVDFNIKYSTCPKPLVEKEVERIIDYLHNHYNTEVYCNIIMGDGSEPFVNHREVWHLKVPEGESEYDYFIALYNKLKVIYYEEN